MVNRPRIIELFEKNSARGAYSLFDSQHPLRIYLGTNNDGQKSLTVINASDRIDAYSTKIVEVKYERYSDNDSALSFNLLDNKFSEFFYSFCEDVISNTYSARESDGFLPVIRRYEAWQAFFKRNNNYLSESEIKGLIGELLFIDKYLIPKFGAERAIQSYIGISNEHKDIELGDTWHEIKAIHNGATSVNISSLEQLDSTRVGHLEVVILDEGARSAEATNLNQLVDKIVEQLSGAALHEFEDKLLNKGYSYSEYYDAFSYIPVSATSYQIVGAFPKLSRDNVPDGVLSAKYELSLIALNDYKESTWI